jgi:hypothetical protein
MRDPSANDDFVNLRSAPAERRLAGARSIINSQHFHFAEHRLSGFQAQRWHGLNGMEMHSTARLLLRRKMVSTIGCSGFARGANRDGRRMKRNRARRSDAVRTVRKTILSLIWPAARLHGGVNALLINEPLAAGVPTRGQGSKTGQSGDSQSFSVASRRSGDNGLV